MGVEAICKGVGLLAVLTVLGACGPANQYAFVQSALVPAPGPGTMTASTVPDKSIEVGFGGEPIVVLGTRREEITEDVPALWMPVSQARVDLRVGVGDYVDVGARWNFGSAAMARPNRSWAPPLDRSMVTGGVAATVSFTLGVPRIIAFRGGFEYGVAVIPAVVYRCTTCSTEAWEDLDGDGERDSWEEYDDIDHAPTGADSFTRVRSTDVMQPHFLASFGLAYQRAWFGVLGGVTLRSHYTNRGVTYGETAKITVTGDVQHPWVIPYLAVDFTPVEALVVQLQLFIPIDTSPATDVVLPALGGSIRGRIPLAPKARRSRQDDEERDEHELEPWTEEEPLPDYLATAY
jgi:hypothetical protein